MRKKYLIPLKTVPLGSRKDSSVTFSRFQWRLRSDGHSKFLPLEDTH